MSLNNSKTIEITKKQYCYKLKANMRVFLSLMMFQLFALIISLGGNTISSTYFDNYGIFIRNYSGNISFVFTSIWILVYGVMFTQDKLRIVDFTVVSNKITSSLSTVLFLTTCAFAGGISTSLNSVLLRVVIYFTSGKGNMLKDNYQIPIGSILITMAASALYLFLIASIGYFFGTLFSFNRTFALIFYPLLFILMVLRISTSTNGHVTPGLLYILTSFYTAEHSILLFSIKAILTSSLLFFSGCLISNKMEVER